MENKENGSMNPDKDRRRKKFENDKRHEKGSRKKTKNPRKCWEE
jgi:hypothetical protein